MKLIKFDYFIATALVFAAMGLGLLSLSFDMFEPIKNSLEDLKLTDIVDSKIVDRENAEADTNIILINASANKTRLSNLALAKIIAVIDSYEPKVIAVAVPLKKSRFPKFDAALANVLSAVESKVVLASRLENYDADSETFKSIVEPYAPFAANASVGFRNFRLEKDEEFKTIRSFAPFAEFRGKRIPSFVYQILRNYDSNAAKILEKRNKKAEFIKYLGQFKFFRLEAIDVLKQNFDPDMFKGKIAILGPINSGYKLDSSMALTDAFFTPLNQIYAGKAYPDMFGATIAANAVSMVLRNDFMDKAPRWIIYLFATLLVYFNMAIFTFIVIKAKDLYELLSLAVFVVESLSILILEILFFEKFSVALDLTIVIFAIALSILIYEIYVNSLKPISIKWYYKYFHRGT